MAKATITIVLPTTGTDTNGNTVPWDASNYGGAHIFRNGTQIGSIAAPNLTFVDTNAPAGTDVYTASVFNNDAAAAEGPQSTPFSLVVPTAAPTPTAPAITATL
jgi:hypothetical protein